jgi:hypothetical protein
MIQPQARQVLYLGLLLATYTLPHLSLVTA